MKKLGVAIYCSEDKWNIMDQLFVWVSITNIIMQRFTIDILSPLHISMMLISCCFLMTKTFFFLRVFQNLTFLVTMLKQVLIDLQAFIIFYGILVIMFGCMFSIIDVGNIELNDD